jgi:hypothetical protein
MSVARLSSRNHPLYQTFQLIDDLCARFEETYLRRGRPRRFTNAQIIKCMVYQVYYRIHSLRELEWKLKQDLWALRSIEMVEVPDHSTFCRRVKQIEESLYSKIYHEILDELEPESRVCYWDSTALRSSRYDKDAEIGKGTRLGWFHGYKLHAIVSEDLLPLSWDLSPACFYDNQFPQLLNHLSNQDVFMILADAAYDDQKLFLACEEAGIHLATQVNMRRAKSPSSFKAFCRRQNWHYVHQGLGKKLLKKRTRIESLFSTLKTLYGLEQPRLYGIYRYYRHVLWVILVYLLQRLIDKKSNVNTRKAPWNR